MMKTKISIRNYTFALIASLILYVFIGIGSIYGLVIGLKLGSLYPLSVMSSLFINACGIWILISAILLLRDSRRIRSLAAANIAMSGLCFIFISAVTIQSFRDNSAAANIAFIILFAVIPALSLAAFLSFKKAASSGKKQPVIFDKRIFLVPAVLICACLVIFFFISKNTVYIQLAIHDLSASSSISKTALPRICDGSENTWWTSAAGKTADEWVKIELRNPSIISGIRISGGAHSNDSAKGLLLHNLYSRPREISIELSNGKIFDFTMSDSDSKQVFGIPVNTAHWVKIRINSIYEGIKWKEICINEIEILGERSIFSR